MIQLTEKLNQSFYSMQMLITFAKQNNTDINKILWQTKQ